jgi:hypothetical protein
MAVVIVLGTELRNHKVHPQLRWVGRDAKVMIGDCFGYAFETAGRRYRSALP